MKKKYTKPSIAVYAIKISRIICTSEWDNELGHLPGQPTDGKQLA